MTPAELRAVRESLGLTPREAATLLDLETAKSVYRMEMDTDCRTSIAPPKRVLRLYDAYLSGFRPADWPGHLVRRAEDS